MLDVAEHLYRWIKADQDFAVATVVSVSGSAPRMPGAALAVDAGGTAVGSVSGAVWGAVYEACREALRSGRSLVQRFGYSDEDAFAVGLTCGGVVDILTVPVRRTDAHRPLLASALAGVCADEAVALARVTEGPLPYIGRVLVLRGDGSVEGTLDGNAELDRVVAGEARALLDVGHTSTVTVGADGSYCGEPAAARGGQCSATAHDRFRGRGLRGRPGAAGEVPRPSRDGVRRPPGVRHPPALRGGRRGGRGVAAPLPRKHRRRPSDRVVRADARREVRCASARPRVAPAGGLRRGHGVAPYA